MDFKGNLHVDGHLAVDGTSTYGSGPLLPEVKFTNKASNSTITSAGGEGDVPGLTGITFPENKITGDYLVSLNVTFNTAAAGGREDLIFRLYVGDGDLADGAGGLVYTGLMSTSTAWQETRTLGVFRLLITGMTSSNAIGLSVETTEDVTIYGSSAGLTSSIEIEPI